MIYEKITKESKDDITVRNPQDLLATLLDFYDGMFDTEHFVVAELNSAHVVIALRVVSIGTISRTMVHPREIFRNAIMDNAFSIICIHNHPSGVLMPSLADDELTKRLKQAADIVGIRLVDHMIINEAGGYYSYLENKKIGG